MEFLFPSIIDHNITDIENGSPLVEMHSAPQIIMQTCLYGYILFVAANIIGDSSELLLLVPEYASLVGSIVLPILGAVPDGMMVLFSGQGPPEVAQAQVTVGVGALAGSTVMLLTLPWCLSILCGRVSINADGKLNYKAGKNEERLKPKDKYSLTRAGVTLLPAVKKNSYLMFITALSYLVIQIPSLLVDPHGLDPKNDGACKNADDDTHYGPCEEQQAARELVYVWIALGMTVFFFFAYLYLMYKEGQQEGGQIEERAVQTTVAAIQNKQINLRGAIMAFQAEEKVDLEAVNLSEGLISDGKKEMVKKLVKLLCPFFAVYDTNKDNQISLAEFGMLLRDMGENVSSELTTRIFNAADLNHNNTIGFDEFVACMVCYTLEPKIQLLIKQEKEANNGINRRSTASAYVAPTPKANGDGGDEDGEEEEEEEEVPADLADLPPDVQQKKIKMRAFQGCFFGTVMVLLFSDPMVDMLGLIGEITGMGQFIAAFLLAPIASNASELVSSMKMASKRTPKSMMNACSTCQGACIMNNTYCLAIFLFLIVWKGLAWKFTAETASIVLIEILIGLIAMKSYHTVLDGFIILLCFPGALGAFLAMQKYFPSTYKPVD
jgi:Ca2+/Na+ antiporter